MKIPKPLDELPHALGNGGIRTVFHGLDQIGDVGIGVRHITGLQRQHLFDCGPTYGLLYGGDVLNKVDRAVIANIEQAPRGVARGGVWVFAIPRRVRRCNLVAGTNDAFHNVIHVGEVSAVVAVVEDLYGLAFNDVLGELEQGHVGPAPGAIHGEEAQAGGGQAEQVAVAVGHEFVGAFGGGVELQGVHGGHVF